MKKLQLFAGITTTLPGACIKTTNPGRIIRLMTKQNICLVLLVFMTSTTFGQIEELQLYTNLYRSADSLNQLGHPGPGGTG
jgi:hypothetical protein